MTLLVFFLILFYSSSELEETSLKHVTKEDMEYLRDQTSLPYLPWKDNFTSEELAQYLSNPPSFAICKDRPAVCQKNAIFLIDREILASDDDLKSDDFSWRNNGTNTTTVNIKQTTCVLSGPTLCTQSIKTSSVGSTVSVSQMAPQASTSCCVIDLRKENTKYLHVRKPVCNHRH